MFEGFLFRDFRAKGCRVWGLGLRIQGSGLGVEGGNGLYFFFLECVGATAQVHTSVIRRVARLVGGSEVLSYG